MDASTPPILLLPVEILDKISELLLLRVVKERWPWTNYGAPRHHLGNLSLTSRALLPSAQRALFHTFRLEYCLESFANLIRVSQHPVLRQYVRCMEYTGIGDNPGMTMDVYRKFSSLSFEEWVQKNPTRNLDSLFADKKREIQLFDQERRDFYIAAQGVMSGNIYAYGKEYLDHGDNAKNMLRALLAKLPNISGFECVGLRKEGLDGPDRHSWTLFTTWLELHALDARKLERLRLTEQYGSEWASKASVLLNAFTKLPHLRIFAIDFIDSNSVSNQFFNAAEALSRLVALQTLDLCGYSDFQPDSRVDIHLSCFVSPASYWKHLTNLSLHGLAAEYDLLIGILSKHAESLRTLRLGCMRLTTSPSYQQSSTPPSWIDVFIFLNEKMSLLDFTHDGWLDFTHDGWLREGDIPPHPGYEYWDVTECKIPDVEHPKDCLLYKIRQYVTHRGAFPFDGLLRGHGYYDAPNACVG